MTSNMPVVLHFCRARRIALSLVRVFACTSVLLTALAHAIDLVEGTNKLGYGKEIEKEYLRPLGLRGKSASKAVQTLLGEGFLCDIEPMNPVALDKHPHVNCVKSPSGFGPLCAELLATVRLEFQPGITSREELSKQLDSTKVDFVFALCPYPHEVSIEYLTARTKAEATLQHEVNAQQLAGNAKAAYDKLMLQGFSCGFERGAEGTSDSAKLTCTKLPSGVKYCFQSKLVMDVKWPQHVTTMKQLFGALPLAEIKAINSSCVIPLIRSAGQPRS
jgi:hypothetical protein